jgi:glycosyltransferase involved in cell wall biosynthesis
LLISCLIPTRNRPDFILQSASSVLSQTHQNIELIIINDGTTPVPAIDDSRVRILNSGEAGAVPARNLGAAAATGEALAWLDDDDTWTDELFLAECVQQLRCGAAFVFGDGAMLFPDGARKPFAQDADTNSLTRDNTILVSAICYCRSLHDELGPFDTALPFYWDWDWYLRVARAGHVLHRLERPVVDIRVHASNMSGQSNAAARSENLGRFAAKHGLGKIPLKAHTDFV